MIRVYKYRAFAPRSGREAFFAAIALKREMWADLCAMQAALAPRLAAARQAKEADTLAALRTERKEAVKAIRQRFAAQGLAWGDYNAVIFQFDGAVRASAARKALPSARDGALGEAVVRQIMGGCPPAALATRNDVCLEYLPPSGAELRRKPGSHRAGYRTARMAYSVRTDRNPAGPADLVLDMVIHRPIPPAARIVEVRVIRDLRPVIRRDGRAGEVERWAVTFACEVEPDKHERPTFAGIMPTWRATGDGVDTLMIAYDDHFVKRATVGTDHLEQWRRSREMFAAAEAETDADARETALAAARIHRRRLERRRTLFQRTLARDLARRYAIIAVPKLRLANKGSKQWTAPAQFMLVLRHAVERAGGSIIAVDLPKDIPADPKKRARWLRERAIAEIFGGDEDDIQEAAQ